MELIRVYRERLAELAALQLGYKEEIGEERPAEEDFARLAEAMEKEQILFYGCLMEGKLVACCSVTPGFSTFNYRRSGVFEDFYILPAYRRRGIARELVQFAYRESGVSSLTVGCADCDLEMYQALGFRISLGNLLAFE